MSPATCAMTESHALIGRCVPGNESVPGPLRTTVHGLMAVAGRVRVVVAPLTLHLHHEP